LPPGITLAPEDLFLGKAQIHAITRPDLVDIASLVTAVPLETMDVGYLQKLLGEDWGLWYDVRANVEKCFRLLLDWSPDGAGLTAPVLETARIRLRAAIDLLDRLPKSRRWEKRAATGTTQPWFEDVDEIR
jgi:hypothetical protein